jgi:Protein of unknown function (DUF4230)
MARRDLALLPGKNRYLSAMRRMIFIIVAVVIFVAGLWLGFKLTHWGKPGSELREESTATVVEQVQALSDLVTVRYVVEKVVVLEDVKWYGENRVLLLAHGIVKAGINFQRLKPGDVMISGRDIAIRLPPAEITDAYLDEKQTRVIDNSTGLLRLPDKNLAQIAHVRAVDDIRRAAREDGILEDATRRAQLELALFLQQAGFQRVQFIGPNAVPQPTPTNRLNFGQPG